MGETTAMMTMTTTNGANQLTGGHSAVPPL